MYKSCHSEVITIHGLLYCPFTPFFPLMTHDEKGSLTLLVTMLTEKAMMVNNKRVARVLCQYKMKELRKMPSGDGGDEEASEAVIK